MDIDRGVDATGRGWGWGWGVSMKELIGFGLGGLEGWCESL